MLHVRVIASTRVTARVVNVLATDEGVTHLVVLPGVARSPHGDVVEL